jgi:hypothetical protein
VTDEPPGPPPEQWPPGHQPGGPPPQGWTQPGPGQWGQQPGTGAPPPAWGPGAPPPGWGQGPPPQPTGWGGAPPPGWGYGPPPAARPGVIPLRPLGVGEILDGAFSTIRSYPVPTLGLSAIAASISALMQLAFLLPLADRFADATSSPFLEDNFDPWSFFGPLVAFFAVFAIGSVVVGAVLTGIITVVLGEGVLGRPITLGEAWRRVRGRVPALIGLAVLQGLAIAVGMVLCVLPGIYLWVSLSLSPLALVLEKQSITGAMRRSFALVSGAWWRVFGILLLATIITGIVGNILQLPFSFIGSSPWSFSEDLTAAGIAFSSIGQIVAGTVTGSALALIRGVLYVDRRIRAEAFDITLSSALQQSRPG